MNLADKLLVQISILFKYVLQIPMYLCIIYVVPVPLDVNTYLESSIEYTQMHVQYPYIVMFPDSYIPFTHP